MINTEVLKIIDCEELRYGVDKIVREIMRAENSLLRRIPRDQKVVVLLGQPYDNMPLHTELYKAVLNAHITLQDAVRDRSFGFGYEAPANGYIHGANLDSIEKITAYFQKAPSQRFLQEEHDLFAFCEENDIPTALTDVAQDASRGQHVDFKDAFTQAVMDKYNLGIVKRRDGSLHIQNDEADRLGIVCTAERIQGLMQEEQRRIFVQQCNIGRVAGYQEDGADDLLEDHSATSETEEKSSKRGKSLYAELTGRGFAVLPVLINYNKVASNIPLGSADAVENVLCITNFTQSRYTGLPMKACEPSRVLSLTHGA